MRKGRSEGERGNQEEQSSDAKTKYLQTPSGEVAVLRRVGVTKPPM